ncbi:MAG: hypothetical protein HYW90_04030 [Candidatus Sungbacteria bacterium]|nr:hypothetical protein [Candidatus Sungbacteria bacterium]
MFFSFFKTVYFRIRPKIPIPKLEKKRWLYLPRLFSGREKTIFYGLIIVALISGTALSLRTYLRFTVIKPAFGGTYREGLLKGPRFINPIYAASNDTDRDITELVFSGLVRYSPEGNPEPDLAETFEISEGGKNYTIRLRENLLWHDGESIDADDVLFTIKTIQNPEFKSPWRQNWQGVTVEKLDRRTVRFSLKQPYAPFIESLSIGIIPEHLWARISPQSAALTELNLKPVGSGPYRFDSFTRLEDGSVTSYTLSAFKYAPHGRPHIKKIIFSFYPTETETLAAYRKNEIDGVSAISAKSVPQVEKTDIILLPLRIPRVIGIFLNSSQQSAFAEKKVRTALTLAIDAGDIIQKILGGAAEPIASPIPPANSSFNENIPLAPYDIERAKMLLAEAGWKDSDKDGILDKTELKNKKRTVTPLKIEITTSDFPELSETAAAIKEMWRAVGVDTEIKIMNSPDLEISAIRPRAYQALLFGEIFGHDPDPFAFWHTSQIKDPGLNIALYSNRKVDSLLEEARRTADNNTRKDLYQEFQKIVAEDAASIFLFSPISFYGVRNSISGITIGRIALPHERFSHIEEWYIKTKRGLK